MPVQRPHPAQRIGAAEARPQRIDLGQGKARTIAGDRLGEHVAADRPAGLLDRGEQHAVALSKLLARQAGLAQEAFERLRRRARARALDLLADRLGRFDGRPRAISASRRGVDQVSIASPAQPRRRQLLAEQPREIVRAARLHPRRDLLGQQLEQEVRSSAWPPPIAFPSRPRRRPWRGRGRGRYRPAARRPR